MRVRGGCVAARCLRFVVWLLSGVRKYEDTRFVRCEVEVCIAAEKRFGGACVGINLLAGFVGRRESGETTDGLVGRVSDEVDVGVRKFAADEADLGGVVP